MLEGFGHVTLALEALSLREVRLWSDVFVIFLVLTLVSYVGVVCSKFVLSHLPCLLMMDNRPLKDCRHH